MNYHLAQVNIAQFRLPADHAVNAGFMNNLDRVNALAETSTGFIWRMVGDGNSATDIQAFADPNKIINISLWESVSALSAFVYRNKEHRAIMRKRADWFNEVEIHLALWWVPEGHIPSIDEAKMTLEMLAELGPTEKAFTFKQSFPKPMSTSADMANA